MSTKDCTIEPVIVKPKPEPPSTFDAEARMMGITGTDISAIMGQNKWKRAAHVWADKVGKSEPQPDSEMFRLARRWESHAAQLYSDATGVELVQASFVGADDKPHCGTPDYLALDGSHVVEIKTTSRPASEWANGIPIQYVMQCAWYCYLLKLDMCAVAVLHNLYEFRIYYVHRDPALEAMMIDAADTFWADHVLTGIPPEIDGSESTRKWVESQHPQHGSDVRVATTEEADLCEEYRQFLAAAEVSQAAADALANQIRDCIGEDSGIEWHSGKITWRAPKKPRKTIDWKGLGRSLGATPDDIAEFTTETPGSRRFVKTFREIE